MPSPAPRPTTSRTPLACLGIGCAVLLALGLASVSVAALFWLTAASPSPKPSVNKAEVIEYGPIIDREEGASSTWPSGESATTLTTKRGVIENRAHEFRRTSELTFPNKAKLCRQRGHLTDILKKRAFDIDKDLRKEHPLSTEEEVRLGHRIAGQFARDPRYRNVIDSPRTASDRAYLARVAQPLLAEIKHRDIEYHFHVIEDPTVNAFALPGGHIYFFTGLLYNEGGTWLANEAQLAGILAHEISHVDLGHCAATYQYLKALGLIDDREEADASTLLSLARGPFSSNQEDEADVSATKMLHLAQYDPSEFVRLWDYWDKHLDAKENDDGLLGNELNNLLRSHSDSKARACNVLKQTEILLKTSPFDRFYIGTTNRKRLIPRTQEQF